MKTLGRTAVPIVGIVAIAAAMVAIVPAAQATPDKTAESTADNAGLARFTQQQLDWNKCQLNPDDEIGEQLDKAGARCADVTVPLDYSHPSGRTITVAISRIEATDTHRRVRAMLINGGGPGGDGIDMPLPTQQAMGQVAKRYDLIGMDPWFVGRSTPLDCGWPTGSMSRSAGLDRADFDRSVAFARDLADRCGQTEADVLPYVSTRNTARDMDLIRAVLGERELSYLGYSYGTYLGAVYAEMFPRRADRFVLDGPNDPDTYSPQLLQQAGPANERALHAWASWAAERHETYGLGSTRAEVLATMRQLIEASAREPLHVGEFRLNVNVLPAIFFDMLGSDLDQARAELAKAALVFADAAEHGSAQPHQSLRELLTFLLTEEWSAYGSVQAAILCGDVADPNGDIEPYWRDIERHRPELPLASPVVHNINACEFWPTAPLERPTHVRTDVPALIVAATGDPRAVYENAEPLRHSLGDDSRLVTMHGANQHGVYGEYGNACVDNTVNAYLASGRLPGDDQNCHR